MVEKLYIQHFLSDGSLNKNEEDIVCLPLRSYNDTHIAVTNIEGLAPMPGTINMDDNAGGDGSIFNSSRAQNRNIVITMKPFEEDVYDFDGQLIKASMEACRRKIYLIFPLKRKIRLHVETEIRKYYIDGYVETINADYFGDMEGAQVSILCPDPYFKVNWEDVVDPEVKRGYLLSQQAVNYSIDLSMHNNDIFLYLDHDIPMIITFISNMDTDGKTNVLRIGCGVSNYIEYMVISNINLKNGDRIIINTKNRTVDWVAERVENGITKEVHRNALPFTSFNRTDTVDYYEYYIPGNNPSINGLGKHRLLFNNWFVFDKYKPTKFIYYCENYILNANPIWQEHTYYKYESSTKSYELLIEAPTDWATNFNTYYIKQQFGSCLITPIVEYEGV